MQNPTVKKLFSLALVLLGLWFGLRYGLPLILPFILGLLLAVAAEPLVRLSDRCLRLPRFCGCALGVTVTLVLVLTLLTLLISALIRELGQLAHVLPDMEQTARQGLTSLEDMLLALAHRAPEGVQGLLTRWVLNLFDGDRQWVDGMARHLPGIATSILGHIPNGALTVGTAIISGYMISARLPHLKGRLQAHIPPAWRERVLPTLKRLRSALGSWLAAQAKLCAISFAVLCLGFLLLRIRYAPLWALVVSLVDAMPVLGSGTVLLPWALVRLVQGSTAQALGLVAVYAAVAVTRSVLEPKLLGKQLGLDPLVTLAALYAGFRIWGFSGMIFAPILAVITTELVKSQP